MRPWRFTDNDAEAMSRFVVDRLGYRPGNVIDLGNAAGRNWFTTGWRDFGSGFLVARTLY